MRKEKSTGTPMVRACEKGDLDSVKAWSSRAMTWRRRACRWTRWSVRKGRIVMVTHDTPLQMAAEKEQFEIVQYLVKTCTTTVDLIGQTNSMVGIVYIMLHIIQRRMFKRSNFSLTITMETSKQSSIKRIMMDGHTIRLCI